MDTFLALNQKLYSSPNQDFELIIVNVRNISNMNDREEYNLDHTTLSV